MAYTQTNRLGVKNTWITSDDGVFQCYETRPVTQGVFKVKTNDPQHRPKPPNLTEYSAMTDRALQYLTDQNYGRRMRTGHAWMALQGRCGSPQVSRVCTLVEESPLEFNPVPGYPWPTSSNNWEQALRLKIESEVVSFAENIGEWRESVRMLKGGAGVMQKAYRAARQLWHAKSSRKRMTGNIKQILGKDWKPKTPWEWNDVVSAHLAITYGIKPILGQLEDVMVQLNKVRAPRKRIQVTIPRELPAVVTRPTQFGEVTVNGRKSQRAVAYVQFASDAPDFVSGNIASSLWAGTKLSFMVDWSWNLGGYLQALTALTHVASAYGTVTTRREAWGRVTSVRTASEICTSPGFFRYTDSTRTKFASIPLPPRVDWRFGDPGGASWDQLISAMEIFHQLRRGKATL